MAHELDPVTMGLLSAGAGFLDPRGGLLGGFQSGLQGYQSAVEHNRNNMLQAQMAQKMQDEQDVRNAFTEFGKPDQNGNVDAMGVFNKMMQSGNPAVAQFALLNAQKLKPTVKSVVKVMGNDGQAYHVPVFTDGSMGQPGGNPAAERLMPINAGGSTFVANPFNASPVAQFNHTMSPGDSARLAQSAQQFALQQAQNQNHFNQRMDFDRSKAALDYDPNFLSQKAAAVEGAKKSAQNLVQAQSDLPGALDKGQEIINMVRGTVNHPGFEDSVGKSAVYGKLLSLHPGTQAASFKANLDQLLGGQFLQAFESLKGGGQITEIEGQKATDALSRMKTSNTEQDFVKSANEFIDIVQRGMNRARVKAGQPAVDFSPSNLMTPDQKKSAITPRFSSKLISE